MASLPPSQKSSTLTNQQSDLIDSAIRTMPRTRSVCKSYGIVLDSLPSHQRRSRSRTPIPSPSLSPSLLSTHSYPPNEITSASPPNPSHIDLKEQEDDLDNNININNYININNANNDININNRNSEEAKEEKIFDMERKYDDDDDSTHVSSVCFPHVFRSSLPTWQRIPYRARTPFVHLVKDILTNYKIAQADGDTEQCIVLLHQLLDVPHQHLILPSLNSKSRRNLNPAKALADRLDQARAHLNGPFVRYPSSSDSYAEQLASRRNDPDAAAVRRAVQQIKAGDMKRALKTLAESASMAEINEETMDKLKKLHPAASQPLPLFPHNFPTVIVDPKRLTRLIRSKLNNAAGGGPSGWTGQLLQPLAAYQECMEGLAAVINDICNGVIVDESLRCRLLASRCLREIIP